MLMRKKVNNDVSKDLPNSDSFVTKRKKIIVYRKLDMCIDYFHF